MQPAARRGAARATLTLSWSGTDNQKLTHSPLPLPVLQYSFSLTTFSPSGKLVQIEYALAAVNAGATSLGIRATNGVVLATEKKLPSILVDEATVQKVSLVTPNVGMTYSGMGPDSRVLVRKARKSGQVYYRQYHEQIPVAQLCRETAAVMQEFTRECADLATAARVRHLVLLQAPHGSRFFPPNAESGGVRPFGVSLLMAGYDDNGPQLYQIDPSGSYFAWKASGVPEILVTSSARCGLSARCAADAHMRSPCPHGMQRSARTWSTQRHSWRSGTARTWSWKMPYTPRCSP